MNCLPGGIMAESLPSQSLEIQVGNIKVVLANWLLVHENGKKNPQKKGPSVSRRPKPETGQVLAGPVPVSKRGKHAGNFVLGKRRLDLSKLRRQHDSPLSVGGL